MKDKSIHPSVVSAPAMQADAAAVGNARPAKPGSVDVLQSAPGDNTAMDATDLGSQSTPEPDCYFHPPYPVYQDATTGDWVAQLPHAKIPFSAKPQWLVDSEQLNAILDSHPEPQKVRKAFDALLQVAYADFDVVASRLGGDRVQGVIAKLQDGRLVSAVEALFQHYFELETQSTHREGGSMAGSLCSQMNMYGGIIAALKRHRGRLAEALLVDDG